MLRLKDSVKKEKGGYKVGRKYVVSAMFKTGFLMGCLGKNLR